MKKVFTNGCFDILHRGHIELFKYAKSLGDYLIVGVQSDPSMDRKDKNTPVQSYEERILQVKAIKYVDEVQLYNSEEDPDVRIIGMDHKGKKFTGWEMPIELYFNSRDHGWSTSELRTRIYKIESEKRGDDWPFHGNDVY